jgi:beta-glucosidase
MTSYNKINGIYTSENRGLLQTILRDEWGFKGMVMTDWGGGRHAPAQVHAGNDLLMPGSARQAKDIVEAVQNGTLGIQNVNANVRRVLEYILKTPHFKAYAYTDKPDLKAHAQVTRHSAEEGMVLLKDDGHALPLKSGLKAAVFGNTSYNFISGGTGSGDVNEAYTISLVQGLKNDGFKPDTKLAASYAKYKADYDDAHKGEHHPWFEQRKPMPEMPLDEALLKKAAKADAVALITIGRNSGEGADRHVANDFDLSEAEKTLLHDVTDAFHAQHKPVVVILNIGGVIETASWSTIPDAILLAWQGGQEAGNSVADILKGLVNPSGKLPMTFPMSYDEVPSAANFPSNYVFTREPAKYVMGSLGKKDVDYTNYDEDIYVGYRYYDTFDKPVAYPFGYGLSYTSFSYKVAKDANDPYKVQVTVTNTGRRAGKEVVELYVSAPGENKPAQELRAFAKTELLKPGKSETLTLAFKEADLASYNEAAHAWIVDPGNYTVKVGASSRDIRGSYQFDIPQSRTVEVCHDVMLPMDPIRTMKK